MSIFGKLRRAKQAAENQKGEKRNAVDAEIKSTPPPYRHVPTHAATDALLGAPATWREEDKRAIHAQNQRRRSQHSLSRTQSYFSNGTTLNQDQSYASTDMVIHGVTDPGRSSALGGQAPPSAPWDGRGISSEHSSATNFSRSSQGMPVDRSMRNQERRRHRIDAAHPMPKLGTDLAQSFQGPTSPSKDVKFYLPSSREISPSHSSETSNYSYREPSYHELSLPPRHPRRPAAPAELPPRSHQPDNGKDQLHQYVQQPNTRSKRRVDEHAKRFPPPLPPPSAAPPQPPSAATTEAEQTASFSPLQPDNDFSFIDFGQDQSDGQRLQLKDQDPTAEPGLAVTVH